MVRRNITIINKLGLHARAAAKLVATASQYDSAVHISRKGRKVDAKSIMPVMMLAASQGMEVELIAEGDDEVEAIEALAGLIDDYFGEGE
ncbi:HPr family phosphocarrier protein [Marinobacter confluentis]|uniref:HPr family phosphocarrier protein n=1 Tax=Marinobacter confluentis TaxID=1697557 RepID=A0A4Z1C8T9_9GAMM|nr:HPr family phosphocarrier protein [Marinobacter confluentis]TGN40013.1 HPr family phosphocarrier protein [Marinobacter confluentis]